MKNKKTKTIQIPAASIKFHFAPPPRRRVIHAETSFMSMTIVLRDAESPEAKMYEAIIGSLKTISPEAVIIIADDSKPKDCRT